MRSLRTVSLIGLALLPALYVLLWSGLVAFQSWPNFWFAVFPEKPTLPPDTSNLFPVEHETTQFLVAAGTFLLTMVSTVSTVLLAWRGDKRQSREFELKIEQLQLQLEEAKKSKNSN